MAFSLRYPDAELAEAIASGEWEAAVCEVAEALEVDIPAVSVDDAGENENAEAFLHTLRAEATRLFIGVREPLVSPYEGVWRAADDGVQALLFVNPHSMDVERFCAACGLGRPEGTNEPLDHAATECELLEYLASLEAGLFELPDGMERSAFPEGSPDQAYRAFLVEHVFVWMPRFAERLVQETRHPFYARLGTALKAITEKASAAA